MELAVRQAPLFLVFCSVSFSHIAETVRTGLAGSDHQPELPDPADKGHESDENPSATFADVVETTNCYTECRQNKHELNNAVKSF